MREKRLEAAGKEAEKRALVILESLEEGFDPREVAHQISEAVKDLVNDPHK